MNTSQEEKNELSTVDLKNKDKELVSEIISSESSEELNDVVKKFQLNQAKKNALRVMKLSDLFDSVNEQAIKRFEKYPDEFTNKELIEYMKVAQDIMTTTNKNLTIEDTTNSPMIQINQQNNDIKIEGKSIDSDSRQRVLDFVNMALAKSRDKVNESDEDAVVEGTVENKEE